MTYEQAIRALNEAAYAAIRACKDTVQYPDVDRQTLRAIAKETDRLVDELPSAAPVVNLEWAAKIANGVAEATLASLPASPERSHGLTPVAVRAE